MIDVLILVKSKDEELNENEKSKIEEYKKYLYENIKKFLQDKEISNDVIDTYNEESAIDIKCFLNLELEISNKNLLEIYSPKIINQSSKLCKDILENIKEITKINYDNISFLGNDLPHRIPRAFMKLYIDINKEMDIEDSILKISKGLVEGISVYLEIDKEEKNEIYIINYDIENKNKAKQYSKNIGINDSIIELIDYYWELAKDHGGVDPLVAYIQAIIFIGQSEVDYSNFNPGGIRDSKLNPVGLYEYKKFQSLKEGIEAHLDHLALFAGAQGYPKSNSKDPRHFKYLLGSCKTVEDLTGIWDVDKSYGEKIIAIYNEIREIANFDDFKEASLLAESIENKIDSFAEKLISMGSLLETLFKEYSLLYKDLDVIKKEVESINIEKNNLVFTKEELEKKIVKQKTVIKDILNVIGGSLEKK